MSVPSQETQVFQLSGYLIRKDQDDYTVFFPENTETFVINQSAALILKFVSLGLTTEQISERIQSYYGLSIQEAEVVTSTFLTELLSLGLLSQCDAILEEKHGFVSPIIKSLDVAYEKGEQCKIFGMP